MENQIDSLGSIWKIRVADWKVVQTQYNLAIDHGNSMCYNNKLNQLVVIHNKPNYDTISFIDPDTLKIIETRKLHEDMYCIGYDSENDRYVIGISGTFDFQVLDADFKQTGYYYGVDTGLWKQGVDCDEKYIYFPQNSANKTINQIVVYDWDGNYINTVRVISYQEIEDLFHIDDNLYIAFNAGGSCLYKANIIRK